MLALKKFVKMNLGNESFEKIKAILKRYKKILRPIKKSFQYVTLWSEEMRNKHLDKILPKKPSVINLNINDICNSKCIMCNIWKRDEQKEITATELEEILLDPLYKKVKHVGVTGGEPTLRADLPEVFTAVIKSLPALEGVSMITNAIKGPELATVILKIADIAKAAGKAFSVMVSLDGLSIIHDINRGTPGNYQAALGLIEKLRTESNVKISIGCTITSANVRHMEEFLDFLEDKQIYGRFRIAEFIKRLYNEKNTKAIRSFEEEEIQLLKLFYSRLIHNYEQDETVKRTYKSVLGMLNGGKRRIGCPYQYEGVALSSRGEISFCAPQSDQYGPPLKQTYWNLYKKNLEGRRNIVSKKCENCIHDYHFKKTFNEYRLEAEEDKINQIFKTDLKRSELVKVLKSIKYEPKDQTVFILGWYGTETVGDKAILGGIVQEYRKKFSDVQFVIAAIHPFITEQTIKELNMQAMIVPTYSRDFLYWACNATEVVMGGGPLMHIESLHIPLVGFMAAKIRGRKTVVKGCGVGPLSGKYESVVERILIHSDTIELRDSQSVLWAKKLVPNKEIIQIEDPAILYVRSLKKTKEAFEGELSCFFRDWPEEYLINAGTELFDKTEQGKKTLKQELDKALIDFVLKVAMERKSTKISFFPMHTFAVGNDDRVYARKLASYLQKRTEIPIVVHNGLSSVDFILNQMARSELNLCMRYHSVVFANEVGSDFIAIDYTFGGKIQGYLKDCGKMDYLITPAAIMSRNKNAV